MEGGRHVSRENMVGMFHVEHFLELFMCAFFVLSKAKML